MKVIKHDLPTWYLLIIKMAWLALGEALNFGDVFADIVESDWAELGSLVKDNPGAFATFGLGASIPNAIGGLMNRKRKSEVLESQTFRRNINQKVLESAVNLTSVSTMQDNGDEVPVIPPPKNVAKAYADYTTINLPWVQINTPTPTTYLADKLVMRCNSVFDPNATGGIHQPSGRDKFAAFGYKYYRVLEATFHVEFLNTSPAATAVNTDSMWCGIHLTDDSATDFTDGRAFFESKQTRGSTIMANTDSYDGIQKVHRMSYTYRPGDWDHHVQNLTSDERWTPIGENPP